MPRLDPDEDLPASQAPGLRCELEGLARQVAAAKTALARPVGEGGLTNHSRGRSPQLEGWVVAASVIVDRRGFDRNRRRPSAAVTVSSTLIREMSSPHPAPEHEENLELPVGELLRRATVHPPHGERVIDDLTPEEADAFERTPS